MKKKNFNQGYFLFNEVKENKSIFNYNNGCIEKMDMEKNNLMGVY